MSTPKTILVIDVEATCWENMPPNKFPETMNEIIEIGVTPVDIKTLALGKSVGILVKPRKTEVSEFCTKLTTITQEMLDKDGVEFKTALDILRHGYKADRNVFASWGEYDKRSFEKNCKWTNTRYPFANLHLNVKALFAATYGYSGGLDKCAKDLGIPFEGTHHRGVDDSRVIAKILVSLLPEPV